MYLISHAADIIESQLPDPELIFKIKLRLKVTVNNISAVSGLPTKREKLNGID